MDTIFVGKGHGILLKELLKKKQKRNSFDKKIENCYLSLYFPRVVLRNTCNKQYKKEIIFKHICNKCIFSNQSHVAKHKMAEIYIFF